MAERKLKIHAAETAAIGHPHIRIPAPDDQSVATEIGLAKSSEKVPPIDEAHDGSSSTLERAVRQKLMSDPGVNISSLVVRQIEGGVCLEGILETNNDQTDVERLVQSVASVDRVLNRLVTRPPGYPTARFPDRPALRRAEVATDSSGNNSSRTRTCIPSIPSVAVSIFRSQKR